MKHTNQLEVIETPDRYTIDDAVALLQESAGERVEVMKRKLTLAVASGKLAMYEPGRNARIEYGAGDGQSSRVRSFYEEAYWDDLNAWLESFEPRVNFRFPAPQTVRDENNGEIDGSSVGMRKKPHDPLRRDSSREAKGQCESWAPIAKARRCDPMKTVLLNVVKKFESTSPAEVFARLKDMAANSPDGILHGATEEGIQWRDSNDDIKIMTLHALRARLRRLRNYAYDPVRLDRVNARQGSLTPAS